VPTIAIASGKGGTGKTTVATNLAIVAVQAGMSVRLLDCDVEEPDCALFLDPVPERTRVVEVPMPEVDDALCTRCGVCADVCEFRAIVVLPGDVLVFPELCHSCGACSLLCPAHAITEVPRRVGVVDFGRAAVAATAGVGEPAGGIETVAGRLDVGEAKSPPVIKAVKDLGDGEVDLILIDAPPGTSCPVIESVRGVDLVLLVSEPTPFGLYDLTLAVEAMRALRLPFVVVANRADAGDDRLRDYCAREGIDILLEIPDDRRLAEAYSNGTPAVIGLPEYREPFKRLLGSLMARAGAAADPPADPRLTGTLVGAS
jgi:MinD superfamily P-loop ATPase